MFYRPISFPDETGVPWTIITVIIYYYRCFGDIFAHGLWLYGKKVRACCRCRRLVVSARRKAVRAVIGSSSIGCTTTVIISGNGCYTRGGISDSAVVSGRSERMDVTRRFRVRLLFRFYQFTDK